MSLKNVYCRGRHLPDMHGLERLVAAKGDLSGPVLVLVPLYFSFCAMSAQTYQHRTKYDRDDSSVWVESFESRNLDCLLAKCGFKGSVWLSHSILRSLF